MDIKIVERNWDIDKESQWILKNAGKRCFMFVQPRMNAGNGRVGLNTSEVNRMTIGDLVEALQDENKILIEIIFNEED